MNKRWCINSGTYPTIIEVIAGDDDHIKCSKCGRIIRIRRYEDYDIISHHVANESEQRKARTRR